MPRSPYRVSKQSERLQPPPFKGKTGGKLPKKQSCWLLGFLNLTKNVSNKKKTVILRGLRLFDSDPWKMGSDVPVSGWFPTYFPLPLLKRPTDVHRSTKVSTSARFALKTFPKPGRPPETKIPRPRTNSSPLEIAPSYLEARSTRPS